MLVGLLLSLGLASARGQGVNFGGSSSGSSSNSPSTRQNSTSNRIFGILPGLNFGEGTNGLLNGALAGAGLVGGAVLVNEAVNNPCGRKKRQEGPGATPLDTRAAVVETSRALAGTRTTPGPTTPATSRPAATTTTTGTVMAVLPETNITGADATTAGGRDRQDFLTSGVRRPLFWEEKLRIKTNN